MTYESYAMGFLVLAGMVISSLGLFFAVLWIWVYVWDKLLQAFGIKKSLLLFCRYYQEFNRWVKLIDDGMKFDCPKCNESLTIKGDRRLNLEVKA